ncbi:MAG: DEAD/DEAH box helicase [Moorea sp. SIO1G6]|uniref:DEAD/DEAH box helicase n=2 Tax=unclassified Moorena TaxID=2683338 RepID=UPI0013BED246|nr:DEAD/DEAH box helicase [Moorena sp. SIO1G6]NET66598.1 DEAD/DEAH box helicase [Moorena sp. SIO1G6]
MATLHGSWISGETNGHLFIWGETWRTKAQISTTANDMSCHPFAMTEEELTSFLDSHRLSIGQFLEVSEKARSGSRKRAAQQHHVRWQSQIVLLPTEPSSKGEPAYPVLSTKVFLDSTKDSSQDSAEATQWELQPWQVQGVSLEPMAAVRFLQALPLGSFEGSDGYLGGELRFWSQVMRWSFDLLSRGKFLPGVYRLPDGKVRACWQPLLDSTTDQVRLETYIKLMPSACCAYPQEVTSPQLNLQPATDLVKAQELLLGFLSSVVNTQVRDFVKGESVPVVESPMVEWLRSLSSNLSSNSETLGLESTTLGRLAAALSTWNTPVQQNLVTPTSKRLRQNLFRTCFILKPPTSDQENWCLAYGLQAVDDPDLVVDAETIWNYSGERLEIKQRTIEQPQETFLKGLGLATRLYPPIEPSLHQSRPEFCELTIVDVYEFIRASAWRLQNNGLGIVLPPGLKPGTGAKRLGISLLAEVPPQKKNQRLGLQSLLKFKWQLAIGDKTISKREFNRLMALKSPLVEVDGEWMALQPSDVRAAQEMFKGSTDNMTLSVEDALRITTGDNNTLAKLPVVKFEASGALQELITNLQGNQSLEPIPQPASFQGQLRPYQARGMGWLAFLERWGLGACLADDMGLGKTAQLIAFLLHLQEEGMLNGPCLVVCPTSVLGNWEREVKKFAPSLKTIVHHGDKRSKGKAFAKAVKTKQVIITSYSLVHRDATTLDGVEWQGVVLDEAQNIKNPSAKQSQAVKQLSTTFRIALTGTPVENRLSELWSIIDFLNPGYLGDRQFFQRRFAVPIEKFGDRDSLQTMRSLVQPFILRRLKTDKSIIQDLPEKQEMNVFCGLSAAQATVYQQLVDDSLAQIEEAEGIKRKGMILTLLLRLKQLCNHPALLDSKGKKTKGKTGDNSLMSSQQSGKLRRLEEMLEEAISEGDRGLIFTQFSEWGKLLKPYLEEKFGKEVLFLYGATRKKQREEMIDRFQNDPDGPSIFILSLKAGGTGLNLTRANHVFHVDRWWNPAVENQATDRVFRIGQKRNVQVHKFICTGTVEEKINDIIESKKQLAEQTVDAGEDWLTEMNTEQLRDLVLLDRSAVIDD